MNATNIAAVESDVETNVTNIATNETNITTNADAIAAILSSISDNTNAIATNETNIGTNTDAIASNGTNIGENGSAISSLFSTVGDNQTDIADLQDRVVVDQETYVNSEIYYVDASNDNSDKNLFSVDIAANETFDITAYVSDFSSSGGPLGMRWNLKKSDSNASDLDVAVSGNALNSPFETQNIQVSLIYRETVSEPTTFYLELRALQNIQW